MVRPRHLVGMACALSVLGCVGVSTDPRGRYEIVTMTVTPSGGPKRTVNEAGSLQFGSLMTCDTGWYLEEGPIDACEVDSGKDGVSILAYTWVGTGLVPVWSPEPVLFRVPEWDGERKGWSGEIPLGDLSCLLTRQEQDPLVLVGRGCAGPDGGPFDVELVMDR